MKHLIVPALLSLVVLVLINEAVSATSRRRSTPTRRRRTKPFTSFTTAGVPTYKPKITKNTPIEATTFSSPVIKSQTTLGSRTQLFTKVVAGYLVTRYLLSEAPVYRGGFPVYGSYVSIPENRAVRLTSERMSVLDSNGSLCLGLTSQEHNLKEGIEINITEVKTVVKYQDSPGDDKTFSGVNITVPLKDIKENTFTVTSRARYEIVVLKNTQCTQVEKEVNGTMIQLYEFNPNTAGTSSTDAGLIFASITVIGILHGFK